MATCSRDGSVCLWDMRMHYAQLEQLPVTESAESNQAQAINRPWIQMEQVHFNESLSTDKKRRRKSLSTPVQFSNHQQAVTAVEFLTHPVHNEQILVTAGAVDGQIKYWDIRKLPSAGSSKKTRKPAGELYQWALKNEQGRAHGITSICLDQSASRIFASCRDHRIHALNALNYDGTLCSTSTLSSNKMSDNPEGTLLYTLSSPSFRCESFYCRLALSPDEQYIACGSSTPDAFVWKVPDLNIMKNPCNPRYRKSLLDRIQATRLVGHQKESSCISWLSSSRQLVSCSDDMTVRMWSTDCHTSTQLTDETESDEHFRGSLATGLARIDRKLLISKKDDVMTNDV